MPFFVERISILIYNLKKLEESMDRVKGIIITDDREYEKTVSECIRKENDILSLNTTLSIPGMERLKKLKYINTQELFNYALIMIDEKWLENRWDYAINIEDDSCDANDKWKNSNMVKKLKSAWNLGKNQSVIILCYDIYKEGGEFIYKYNTLQNLMNKVIVNYENETGKKLIKRISNSTKTKIVSVVSESGGTGSSVISMGICQNLAVQNKRKCLYISMGKIHQELLFIKSTRQCNLRELLYNMFYGNPEFSTSIQNSMMITGGGVLIFKTTTLKNKILELEEKQLSEFIEYLLRCELFDIIVFDVGNNMDEACKTVVKSSDKVVVTSREIGSNLRREYMEYMGIHQLNEEFDEFSEGEKHMDENTNLENCKNNFKKVISVLNNVYTGGPKFKEFFADEYEDEKYDDIDILIEEDKNSFQWENGIMNIYLSGNFGEGIDKISNMILEN